MATVTTNSCVEEIGKTAGQLWKFLSEQGPISIAKLVKSMSEPRDNVMQAIGWLAREDKLKIEEEGRTRIISLK
jgi:hypothetical protein